MNDGLLIEEAVETDVWKLLSQADRDNLLALFARKDAEGGYQQNPVSMMVLFIRPILIFLGASQETLDGWDDAVQQMQEFRMAKSPPVPNNLDYAVLTTMEIVRTYLQYESDLKTFKTVREVEQEIIKMGNSWTKEEIADTKYRMQIEERYIGA